MELQSDPGTKGNLAPGPSAILDALLRTLNTEGLTSASIEACLKQIGTRKQETLLALLSRTTVACSTPLPSAESLRSTNALDVTKAILDKEASCATALASLRERGVIGEQKGKNEDPLASAVDLAAQHAAILTELQHTVASAGRVAVVVGLQQRLQDYDACVAQGQYGEAARLGMELQRTMEVASMEESSLDSMTTTLTERLTMLREFSASAAPQFLVFDPATHLPTLPPGHQQALQELWTTAEVFQVLPNALASLSAVLVEHGVQPLLKAEGANALIESPAGSVASSALSAATTAARGSAIERSLYKCLKLACEAVGGRAERIVQLGQTLWPAVSDAYIAAKLAPLHPTDDNPAGLDVFVRAGSLGIKLENKAVKLGLWPGTAGMSSSSEINSEAGQGPIAKFVRRSVNSVLAQKRNRYATAARDLLASPSGMKDAITVSGFVLRRPGSTQRAPVGAKPKVLFGDSAIVTAAAAELAGESPLGDVGPYAVTPAAQGLVTLMQDALTEGCRSGNAAMAQTMCRTVVDIAALTVALRDPLISGSSEQERGLPYAAALRHNDCMHVYRALCALPSAHAPRLQALVHPAVNFAAPAGRVLAAGRAALAQMMELQQRELLQVAGELRAWQGMDGHEVIQRNRAVHQLMTAFQRLGSVLRDVLPRALFIEATASLVNALTGMVAESILEMPDISEDESQQIPRILEELIGAPKGGGLLGAAAGGDEALAAQLAGEAREVAKLREVCELLDVPSREIASRWKSGRLKAVGLSREQVAHLIRALFEDNEFSRASLNAVLDN